MIDRPRFPTVRLATWGPVPFHPTTFDAPQRAAVLALLQRIDLVAVGHLAGPLSTLEDLLREAGPHY